MPRLGQRTKFCSRGHDKDIVGRNKQGECKQCRNDTYNVRYNNRRYKLLKRYGITLAEFNKTLEEQNGLCLGCYKHQTQLKKVLRIDHSHKTGKFRGLLCNSCNMAIGMLNDDPEILERLAKYLRKHTDTNSTSLTPRIENDPPTDAL